MKHKILLSLLCGLAHSAAFCAISYLPDSRPPAPIPRRPDTRRSAGPSMFLRKLPPKIAAYEDAGAPVAVSRVEPERASTSAAAPDIPAAPAQRSRENMHTDVVATAAVAASRHKEETNTQGARVAHEEVKGDDRVVTQEPTSSARVEAAASVAEESERRIMRMAEHVLASTDGDTLTQAVAVPPDGVGEVAATFGSVEPAAQLVEQDAPPLPAEIAQQEVKEVVQVVALQDEISNSPTEEDGANMVSVAAGVQVAEEKMCMSEPEVRMVAQIVEEVREAPVLQERMALAGNEKHEVIVSPRASAAIRRSKTGEQQAREILQRDPDIPFPLHGIVFQNFDAPLPKTMAGYRSAERKHQKRHDRRARRRARRNRVA